MDRGYGSRIPRDEKKKEYVDFDTMKQFLERIGLRKPKKQPAKIFTIPTITLDTLVRQIGRPIDLLQMDVQGLEVEV